MLIACLNILHYHLKYTTEDMRYMLFKQNIIEKNMRYKKLEKQEKEMTEESIYKKYNLTIDGKKTFVYALKNLTLEEAKKELKD